MRKNDCLVYMYSKSDVPCLFDGRSTEFEHLVYSTDLTNPTEGKWVDGEESTTGDLPSFYFLLPKEYML